MSNFEIYKTLVASTMHVTPSDLDILRGYSMASIKSFGKKDFICHEHDNGYRVFVNFEEVLDRVGKYEFSSGFKALVVFALSNDCRYLELDCDGLEYDRFPNYTEQWDEHEAEESEKNDWDCTTQGEWA